MSEKKLFDKEVTRRQFLKVTGKGMAGLAASTSLLSLFGVTRAEAEAGAVSVLATATACWWPTARAAPAASAAR